MRPEVLYGSTKEIQTPCGGVYITLNSHEGKIQECFLSLGKSGSCARTMLEALGRVISLAIRSGTDKDVMVKTLKGIRCGNCDNEELMSCPHAIALALEVVNE